MEQQVKSLQEENIALRKQQQEMESIKRQFAEFKHKEEHEKAKIVWVKELFTKLTHFKELVDNSKESLWDTSNSKLTVTGCTIKQECPGGIFDGSAWDCLN